MTYTQLVIEEREAAIDFTTWSHMRLFISLATQKCHDNTTKKSIQQPLATNVITSSRAAIAFFSSTQSGWLESVRFKISIHHVPQNLIKQSAQKRIVM